jgi:hypothetical protein
MRSKRRSCSSNGRTCHDFLHVVYQRIRSPQWTMPRCMSSRPSLIRLTLFSAVSCRLTSKTTSLPIFALTGTPTGCELSRSLIQPGVICTERCEAGSGIDRLGWPVSTMSDRGKVDSRSSILAQGCRRWKRSDRASLSSERDDSVDRSRLPT